MSAPERPPNLPWEQGVVRLYTDGSCHYGDGCGGWAAIVQVVDRSGELHESGVSGWEIETTNNRMELTAVIEGLAVLKRKVRVEVFSDSEYVVNGIARGWARGWKEKGWRKNDGEVKNADLWNEVVEWQDFHEVRAYWIKGHDGHRENDMCDVEAGRCRRIALSHARIAPKSEIVPPPALPFKERISPVSRDYSPVSRPSDVSTRPKSEKLPPPKTEEENLAEWVERYGPLPDPAPNPPEVEPVECWAVYERLKGGGVKRVFLPVEPSKEGDGGKWSAQRACRSMNLSQRNVFGEDPLIKRMPKFFVDKYPRAVEEEEEYGA